MMISFALFSPIPPSLPQGDPITYALNTRPQDLEAHSRETGKPGAGGGKSMRRPRAQENQIPGDRVRQTCRRRIETTHHRRPDTFWNIQDRETMRASEPIAPHHLPADTKGK